MRWTNRTAVALLAAMAAAGCATITRGTIEALAIETDPAGATAHLSNGMQCTTPCAVLVSRRGEIVVTVEKAGYESVEATVASSVKAAGATGIAGNYFLGPVGIVGAVVDSRGGATLSRQPNPLVIRMEPLARAKEGSGADAARPALDECAAKISRCVDPTVREATPEPSAGGASSTDDAYGSAGISPVAVLPCKPDGAVEEDRA